MKKILLASLFVALFLGLTACKSQDEDLLDDNDVPINGDEDPVIDDDPIIEDDATINDVIGLEDTIIVKNAYFNPLKDVVITNQNNEDITHFLHVLGQVHYGKVGTYTLTYSMEYGEDSFEKTRLIEVVEGVIQNETAINPTHTKETVQLGEGSYITGSDASIEHPINPLYIAPNLLTKAVPSNGWWTALLVQNYGGSNGIYTNPLRSSFSNEGVEITNPGSGFVQYWNPEGYNTMANFSLALPDFHLKSTDLNTSYQTTVIDYSDTSVQVSMRNTNNLSDHMVITYAQGSPYIFAEVANGQSPYIKLATNGVSNYEFFTVGGNLINGSSYTGDGIIVKLVQKHVGYQTSRPAQVGQPTYEDRFFLISAPEGTVFTFRNDNHPFGLNNRIDMDLQAQNYFSVAALDKLSEGNYYHEHAFNRSLKGDVSYVIDYTSSDVYTTYHTAYQTLRTDKSETLLQFMMPHHYQNTDAELTQYKIRTVRGELRLYEGNYFQTKLAFNGVIPAMTHPNNDAFSEDLMIEYLTDLASRTKITDLNNFLNDEGPYWNSKAIYPLAQGIIIADQIENESIKSDLIEKLRYVLVDWFTATDQEDDRYLFYNQTWGSVYYSNNDFNTASELSDHSFTHGYLVYAASVLAMYDPTFVEDYGDMVDLLLRDYMHPVKDDTAFAYLRSFDPWAGHTWAHGFGTFAEGNNLESSSEAINSWVGGYLWALATNDQALKDAAIYGFVHEVNHAKTYMFDYSKTIFPEAYSQYAQVAGMVWGGKYDYATWFGANPTFIYGIQWLPNGEYLSSYALNASELTRLSEIYTAYLFAKNHQIDTWYANMWSIQALIDPNEAINQFNAELILNDDYPSDLSQTYFLIHALNAYGSRHTEYIMEVHHAVAASIYINQQGDVHAMIWNPSDASQTVIFRTPTNDIIEVTIEAYSFKSIRLND